MDIIFKIHFKRKGHFAGPKDETWINLQSKILYKMSKFSLLNLRNVRKILGFILVFSVHGFQKKVSAWG